MPITGLNEAELYECDINIRKAIPKEGLPFATHEEHKDCVASWGVDGSKRHNIEGVEEATRPSKTKFVTIGKEDADLVEA